MCLGMGMVVEPTTSARELEGSNWMMEPEKEQVRAEEEWAAIWELVEMALST